MSMSWTYEGLKRNAPGVILFGGLFAIMAVSALNKSANDASLIRSVVAINGTIKSVYWAKNNGPTYALSLNDNSLVFVDDEQPHLIGSNARIERVTRNNGSVSYRFSN
ncbi:MAG: hypothetical protein E5Y12_22025 [Mesorhizobium sp.]|nr:hypothetical protein X740_23210 [Mesorhizobium sp. LNHC221B00]TIN98476.1 MAG: hypothetical protein E5Y06_00595 [Mesorhizobium sp.]TJU99065.1 MAG: hypothetical protein E5Y08_09280 [Mesorhizobium sp.]TJV00358.1 MAG: hypothetical protein E5Y12_22025 [Mesorhizobium sp.]TJV19510.1 MAG: hypothetical protein E5Y07_05550 [Mesorhizobium sp.]